MITKIVSWIQTIIAYFLIVCIRLVRPMLGPMNICPYTIGCTQYALLELKEQPLLTALKNITQRLLRCHPWR